MTIPTRPVPINYPIDSIVAHTDMIEVTLDDDTILWIPRDTRNSDYSKLLAWAERNNIPLT